MLPYPGFANAGNPFLAGNTSRLFSNALHESVFAVYILTVFVLVDAVRSVAWPSSRIESERARYNTVPYTVPFIRNTIPFVTNCSNFLREARQLFPHGATLHIPLIQDDIYLIQGPKNVAELFHDSRTTVSRAYSLILHHCFGMGRAAADAYAGDTSGARPKPILGSSPGRLEDRIILITHENLVSGLLKEGLEPITERFERRLFQSLQSLEFGPPKKREDGDLDSEWLEVPDLATFFEHHLGSSMIRALFGDQLLDQHPHFLQELWEYDKGILTLAHRIPRFLAPTIHNRRDKLLEYVKAWHSSATASHSNDVKLEVKIDSYSDPFWGTKMMRDRYQALLGATGQDKSSVASADLAAIWATVTNVVPSSATLILQIFRSEKHLSSLRSSLLSLPHLQQADTDAGCFRATATKELESIPLLLSMYAETLRFGVRIHIPRTAPHHDVRIGSGSAVSPVPKGALMVTNTWLAHTDEVWDTKDGRRPVDEFWAERFLVCSGPSSCCRKTATARHGYPCFWDSQRKRVTLTGPTKKKVLAAVMSSQTPGVGDESVPHKDDKDAVTGSSGAGNTGDMHETVYFSTENLEGAWIPFGGGQHACPGRLLAKRVMLITAATMVAKFDIEILTQDAEALKFACPRFGLGVAKPSGPVRFRMRRKGRGVAGI